MKKYPLLVFSVVCALIISGCEPRKAPAHPKIGANEGPPAENAAAKSPTIWAVNMGGPAYTGVDGTRYEAESSVRGGMIGQLDAVKGSQDAPLYRAYRKGDIKVDRVMANGRYDITFHFAEPEQVSGGERIFDAIVEGRTVIDGLDVMLARDGKIESALTVTVPNIEVSDGELNIGFDASVREPILSALSVRPKAPVADTWELVWSDEFDYEGEPDPERWNVDIWPPRVVNDEDQAYTADSKNLLVSDGKLVITALREDVGDAKYTSARIHSHGKGDLLYGRIEVRAKLPRGKGTWPAIWMLPSDPFKYATSCKAGEEWQGSETCNAWPNSGEIDIMEHVGYQMNHIHGTVHNQAYYWAKWEQRKGRILLDDVDQKFYLYALEWTPEDIKIFVDDSLYFYYVNEGTGWESWPYDQPFHVILNIAVGGMWGRSGGGIDDQVFPQQMEVDYVRFYQQASAGA